MLVHAAFQAALDGNQVLIACPVGPLIDVYKDRLPPNENIVVETVPTPSQPPFLPWNSCVLLANVLVRLSYCKCWAFGHWTKINGALHTARLLIDAP